MRYQDWIEKERRDWNFDQKMENWDRMVPADPPKCKSCGVPFRDHPGLEGTCAELQELRQIVLDWHQRKEGSQFRLRVYARVMEEYRDRVQTVSGEERRDTGQPVHQQEGGPETRGVAGGATAPD